MAARILRLMDHGTDRPAEARVLFSGSIRGVFRSSSAAQASRGANWWAQARAVPRVRDEAWIEQQAAQIVNPLDRLRFLRQVAATAGEATLNESSRRPRIWMRTWGPGSIAAALLAGFALWPLPTGTAEMQAREQRLLAPGAVAAAPATNASASISPRIWRVDASDSLEVYSNGLRIDLTYAVANRPRNRYPIFPLAGAGRPTAYGDQPVGIVYHTTESQVAPFEEDENHLLKKLGRNLLEVIRQERAYHYVIDRFGRVYGVVHESDAANHAGKSIWADSSGVYLNLNDSFLGIAFEGQTGVDETVVNPAQLTAARALTDMLRARYHLAAESCVTHAQVSVNPSNMHIGSHTDWAGNFPFGGLGLPDNYSVALPSVYAFGFQFDDHFILATGGRWRGLILAEEQVARQAAANNTSVAQYRAILQHRYKDIAATLEQSNVGGS